MTMILALAGALTAVPSCSSPAGEAVELRGRPLSVERLGGGYRTDTGWPPPGEARVGVLRYDWGQMLQSDDRRFADFDLSPGPVHSRSSGCWFQWDSAYDDGKVARVSNGRIATDGYREGYVPPRPNVTPTVSGYRFVAATPVHRDGMTWVGVWNAEDRAERSQIIAFGPERFLVLATLPVRLGGVSNLPDLHTNGAHLTLIGEGRPGEPVPWMRLIWP